MSQHPLELLIEQYLAEKDITRGTWELYHTILKQYTSYLKEHEILYAKASDVLNYIAHKPVTYNCVFYSQCYENL